MTSLGKHTPGVLSYQFPAVARVSYSEVTKVLNELLCQKVLSLSQMSREAKDLFLLSKVCKGKNLDYGCVKCSGIGCFDGVHFQRGTSYLTTVPGH